MKTTYELVDAINFILTKVGLVLITHYTPINYVSYLQVSLVKTENEFRHQLEHRRYEYKGLYAYKAGTYPKSPKSQLYKDLLRFYLTICLSGSILSDIDSYYNAEKINHEQTS